MTVIFQSSMQTIVSPNEDKFLLKIKDLKNVEIVVYFNLFLVTKLFSSEIFVLRPNR